MTKLKQNTLNWLIIELNQMTQPEKYNRHFKYLNVEEQQEVLNYLINLKNGK